MGRVKPGRRRNDGGGRLLVRVAHFASVANEKINYGPFFEKQTLETETAAVPTKISTMGGGLLFVCWGCLGACHLFVGSKLPFLIF